MSSDFSQRPDGQDQGPQAARPFSGGGGSASNQQRDIYLRRRATKLGLSLSNTTSRDVFSLWPVPKARPMLPG